MIFIRSPLQGLFAIYVITSSLSCAHDNHVNSCSAGNTKISLLCVNFNDVDRGDASAVRYTAAKLEQDFNWNMLGYTSGNGGNNYFGPLGARGTLQADSVWIVPDPAWEIQGVAMSSGLHISHMHGDLIRMEQTVGLVGEQTLNHRRRSISLTTSLFQPAISRRFSRSCRA